MYLRYLFSLLAVLYILGTVLGGIGLGWIALHLPSHPVTQGEEINARAEAKAAFEEFSSATITTPDGVILRTWFIRPRHPNGDAVVLLHGVSDNRLRVYGYAKWLLQNNYAVVLPDARAHGLSSGLATYGIRESNDIHQWVSWLEDAYHPRCVYGLGESMGASQLLQALPKEPRFCAVAQTSPGPSSRILAGQFGGVVRRNSIRVT